MNIELLTFEWSLIDCYRSVSTTLQWPELGRLTEEEITKLVEEAAEFAETEARVKMETSSALQSYVDDIKYRLNSASILSSPGDDGRRAVLELVEDVEAWLESDEATHWARTRDIDERLIREC